MQRYFRFGTLMMLCLLSFLIFADGQAAGKIKAEDFSYRNISLGDSEEALSARWGEPDVQNEQVIWGIHLKTFTYGDVVASTSVTSGKVVDINLIGEKYRLRKDVHYGSTSSYLLKVYGKAERQFLDGHICYVFSHPEHPRERLILNLDAEHGALQSARITMLPLTDEEADEMALSEDASFVELDLKRGFIASKEIDVSALPKEDAVQLGGYVQ